MNWSPDSASASPVSIRLDPPSATIVLKRPERGNACSRSLVAGLSEALADLHQEKRVRCVILTGAGDAFCTGTDLVELGAASLTDDRHQQWFDDAARFSELLKNLLRFPKPIIAAVNGPALGTGLAIVAACDLTIASPQSKFGVPEVRRGLTSSLTLPLLAFRTTAGYAADLALRGEVIDVDQAFRIGLVSQIVPHDQLWAKSNELAAQIALGSAEAVALTKRVLNETVGESILTQLTSAAAAMASMRTTENAEEGVRAFLQKRPPSWN